MDLDDFPIGPFHLRDADSLGVRRRRVRSAEQRGLLVRRTRGIYQRSDLPDTLTERAQAVSAALAPHHVAVDRTAAWLHGVDVFPAGELASGPLIESCALRGRTRTRRPEVDGRSRDLAPEDVMTVAGVPVTTPLRTALDLGCHLHQRDAFAAMCLLARRHGLTTRDLQRELPRYRRRRGVVQLRMLVPWVDPRVESHREAWVLLEVVGRGMRKPELQHWIEVEGKPTFRLDFAWPDARVCLEYDGYDAHLRTPEQRQYDEERRRWLRENGWTVIVVRNGDFTGRSLDRWVLQLARALRPSYTNRRW
ncbi:hypothetical protein L615_005400000100 [Nocardioides sp. J9]|uniref:type IV toxin-antitoxin system AbiEi family antitoxin domain-containing protein n=1 Tax=unclassified Nocardioides TaxID=2615069 RepID=UPI00048CD6FC|nr:MULTISPECIES: type IV toxin-antitoxin system AbiEi family antitoxin domain-containing protein [unclassified Nocardioides]TWG94713.1 hypothetical protein L615_005400000100 [Nocardioides sp. J9]